MRTATRDQRIAWVRSGQTITANLALHHRLLRLLRLSRRHCGGGVSCALGHASLWTATWDKVLAHLVRVFSVGVVLGLNVLHAAESAHAVHSVVAFDATCINCCTATLCM